MWKTLTIVSVLVVALLIAIVASMPGGSMLAFRQSSPDQSTGPYNPNLPQGDPAAHSWSAT